jgi:hypothetical protein
MKAAITYFGKHNSCKYKIVIHLHIMTYDLCYLCCIVYFLFHGRLNWLDTFNTLNNTPATSNICYKYIMRKCI